MREETLAELAPLIASDGPSCCSSECRSEVVENRKARAYGYPLE